ncbi:MAG: hypothetical protein VW868_08085 [Bacteroidota bacterium]
MKYLSIITLLVLCFACTTAPEPTYSINTISNPTEGGSISITPDQDAYEAGTAVTFTATPNEGYTFIDFSGEFSSTSNPLTVAVGKSDMEIVANFQLKSYPLSISVEGNGSIIEQIIQNKSTDYDHGTLVQLTANPDEGWEFVEWGGDASGNDQTTTVTVNEEKNVTALFQLKRYSLSVLTQGQGTTTIELLTEIEPDKDGKYEHGSQVRITAIPNRSSRFSTWSGDTTSTESSIVIEMKSDVEVTAEFSELEKALVFRSTYERDDNNNLTLYIGYDENGNIVQQTKYIYDENNRNIETFNYTIDGRWNGFISYTYTEGGYEQINYNPDSTVNSSFIYLVNENGNIVERQDYDSNGLLTSSYQNSWDNSGNILEYQQLDANGNLTYKITYSYDANGNRLEQAYYAIDGSGLVSLLIKTTYTYNSLNQLIEQLQEYISQNVTFRTTYTYNEEGRISGSISYSPEGTVRSSSAYEYDLDNGRQEYYQYDSEMNLVSITIQLYNTDLYLIERLYYVIVNIKVVPDFNNEFEEKYPEFSLESEFKL